MITVVGVRFGVLDHILTNNPLQHIVEERVNDAVQLAKNCGMILKCVFVESVAVTTSRCGELIAVQFDI